MDIKKTIKMNKLKKSIVKLLLKEGIKGLKYMEMAKILNDCKYALQKY